MAIVGRGWLAIILWLARAAAALTGAWLRERGKVFLAFVVEGGGAMSSHGEYGLGGSGSGKRVVMLRRSFAAGGLRVMGCAGGWISY